MLLKMGEIIARNMLRWMEFLINGNDCIQLLVYIICISDALSRKYQRERILVSGVGSSVECGLNLSWQRTFKKPLLIGRRGCIQRALNGEMVNGSQRKMVTDASSGVREVFYSIFTEKEGNYFSRETTGFVLSFVWICFCLFNWINVDFTPQIQTYK